MPALRKLMEISLVVGVIVPGSGPLAAGPGRIEKTHPLNAYDQRTLDRVRARAAARLDRAECARILTDFRDATGRTLGSNLESRGLSASGYLRRLSFLDGALLSACRKPNVAMTTSPGALTVFVCPAGEGQITSLLARVESESGSLAEAMVIHEMLHTLGLGENPPTTFEITERVRERCR